MRQIALDTETTGLDPEQGHRIIEIGCVEIVERKLNEVSFQRYLNPKRAIDAGAFKAHKITLEKLRDKPLFADICDEFIEFVRGAEIFMHNAEFDLAFLDAELGKMGRGTFTAESQCTVLDTLELARDRHPGLQNNLDALSERYNIDNSKRVVHGALIDAKLLARIYLAMTGGQIALGLDARGRNGMPQDADITIEGGLATPVIRATSEELVEHERFMKTLSEIAR